MPKKATLIHLTEAETNHLKSIVQKGTVEARVYRRAKMLLLKSEGMSNKAITEKLDTAVPMVRFCYRYLSITKSEIPLIQKILLTHNTILMRIL